jgi:hypothetical protein
MPNHLSHCLYHGNARFVRLAVVALVFCWGGVANAQQTQVYSFEPDLEGFISNPAGTAITLSHETSGLGATHGENSMKVTHARFNGFAGATTQNVPPAFLDPLGIDFLRFNLTNTNRFAPPATDPPTQGVPTFADMSITLFGTLPGNPVPEAQIQYLLSQASVGDLEPGTHDIEIDLRNDGGILEMGGGLNVDTGIFMGYDAWIDAGFVPLEFQIYLNKSTSVTDPAFEWTIYIDNVRVGRDVAGIPGDHNGDGTVDAADYVTWRKNPSAFGGEPEGYDLWRQHFGESTGGGGSGAVPEPASAMLLMAAGACWWGRKRCRTRFSR